MSLCCLSSAIVVDYRADEKGKTLIPSFWTSVILKGAESFGAMCKFFFFFWLSCKIWAEVKTFVNIIFIWAGLHSTENCFEYSETFYGITCNSLCASIYRPNCTKQKP